MAVNATKIKQKNVLLNADHWFWLWGVLPIALLVVQFRNGLAI